MHPIDHRCPIGQCGDPVAFTSKNVTPSHLEGSVCSIATTAKVAEDRVDAPVLPGDGVLAGNDPTDVWGEEFAQTLAPAAAVELVLSGMQPV
jgi:hypothetical protein